MKESFETKDRFEIRDHLSLDLARPFYDPRPLTFHDVLLSGMSYGSMVNGNLEKEKVSGSVMLYRPELPQRGIMVSGDRRCLKVFLSLPTSREELHDFLSMAKGLKCTVNGTPVAFENMPALEEQLSGMNLQMLHHMMSDVLNANGVAMFLSCAMHRLAIGTKEAEKMWAGTDTSVFRDWMKDLQLVKGILLEPVLYENKQTGLAIGICSIRPDMDYIIPLKPIAPVSDMDFTTGKPKHRITRFLVVLQKEGKRIAEMDYMSFLARIHPYLLPYDSMDGRLKAMHMEEWQKLFSQN